MLREEFIDYVVCGLQEELRRRPESLNAQLAMARNEKRRIEGELKRLVDSIAAGTVLQRFQKTSESVEKVDSE